MNKYWEISVTPILRIENTHKTVRVSLLDQEREKHGDWMYLLKRWSDWTSNKFCSKDTDKKESRSRYTGRARIGSLSQNKFCEHNEGFDTIVIHIDNIVAKTERKGDLLKIGV